MEVKNNAHLDTIEHCNRVANLAQKFSVFLNLSQELSSKIYLASLFHDIGKCRIPLSILEKKSKPELSEVELIKLHPLFSYEICIMLGVRDIEILEGVLHHHEDFNGEGYPSNISGYHIPFVSRVLTILDVFDALISPRHYKESLKLEDVLSLLNEMNKEGKFDPYIFKSFIEMLEGDRTVKDIYGVDNNSWGNSMWIFNSRIHN